MLSRALVIGLVAMGSLGAACGGHKATPATPDTTPSIGKTMILSWGITGEGSGADVFLAATDETGGQVSHSIGHYDGTCVVATAAPEMKALMSVVCTTSDGGATEIDAIQRPQEIIILAVRYEGGTKPDPMERQQVTSIPVVLGTGVRVAK